MSEQRRFTRTPSPQTASWFLDLNSSKQLDLNPKYQRRSVWNSQYRQFFIDSVIRNYPTQAIFLEVAVDPDGPTKYKVLDGKQRLTSLISFVNNEFSTPDSLDDINLDGIYYSDLPRDTKTQILSYMLTVESVKDASTAELNQVFDRLNRNVARLNKQELRHAQYGGKFISKMEALADDPFWEEIGLATQARVRRMLDVEYVSEFYLLSALGIQDGKNYLDNYYSEFDGEIPGVRKIDRRFNATKEFLSQIHAALDLSNSRFGNVADFYSLWAATTQLVESDALPTVSAGAARLEKLEVELERQQSKRAVAYLLAARQGSNKAANRELRANTLADSLKGQ